MIVFEGIKAGDLLYDYHSERAGNTTVRRWDNWKVMVIEVDAEKRRALVSWNGNRPDWWDAHRLRRLRRKPGKVRDPFRSRP